MGLLICPAAYVYHNTAQQRECDHISPHEKNEFCQRSCCVFSHLDEEKRPCIPLFEYIVERTLEGSENDNERDGNLSL